MALWIASFIYESVKMSNWTSQSYQFSETELRNMVNDVDQNDNGMIEFNEFLQMMSKKMREGDSEDELKEAFKWVYGWESCEIM